MTAMADQINAVAADLRNQANVLQGIVPGAGGTVVTSNGFAGRETKLDPYWNTVVFQEDFPNLSADFWSDYKAWTSYAQNIDELKAYTTNANPAFGGDGDHYSMKTSKVADIKLADGIARRMLVGRLKTKLDTPDKKNWGLQYQPKFTFAGLPTSTLYDYCIQMAVGVQANAPKGYHKAGLWWVDDARWPSEGENDDDECSYPYNCGGFFHNQGSTSGGDQVPITTNVSQQGQIHVIRAEFVHGQSYKWFVDGELIKTITSRVSAHKRRISLQYEPERGATPPADMDCYLDWIQIMTHL